MVYSDLLEVCVPQSWTPTYGEYLLYNLPKSSDEFISVTQKINSSLEVEIESVYRIQNPYLWGCFQLKKLEYMTKGVSVQVIDMFHCTARKNMDSIASNNLDWRKCNRSKFGKGVSFSLSAKYANKYANNKIGNQRALILTKVLVGNTVIGTWNMKIPPKYFDTSYGLTWKGNGNVYVKYCDFEYYPSYIACYLNKTSLK